MEDENSCDGFHGNDSTNNSVPAISVVDTGSLSESSALDFADEDEPKKCTLDIVCDTSSAHNRKSPITVQEWVEHLPTLNKESLSLNRKRPEDEEQTSLIQEDGKIENVTFPAIPVDRGVKKTRKSIQFDLTRNSSFNSDASRSSVEIMLELREPDPEELLLDLGFGGPPNLVSRLPPRFLKPSKLKGIDLKSFIEREEEAQQTADIGSLGYRGLSGPSNRRHSIIVNKMLDCLKEERRNSCTLKNSNSHSFMRQSWDSSFLDERPEFDAPLAFSRFQDINGNLRRFSSTSTPKPKSRHGSRSGIASSQDEDCFNNTSKFSSDNDSVILRKSGRTGFVSPIRDSEVVESQCSDLEKETQNDLNVMKRFKDGPSIEFLKLNKKVDRISPVDHTLSFPCDSTKTADRDDSSSSIETISSFSIDASDYEASFVGLEDGEKLNKLSEKFQEIIPNFSQMQPQDQIPLRLSLNSLHKNIMIEDLSGSITPKASHLDSDCFVEKSKNVGGSLTSPFASVTNEENSSEGEGHHSFSSFYSVFSSTVDNPAENEFKDSQNVGNEPTEMNISSPISPPEIRKDTQVIIESNKQKNGTSFCDIPVHSNVFGPTPSIVENQNTFIKSDVLKVESENFAPRKVGSPSSIRRLGSSSINSSISVPSALGVLESSTCPDKFYTRENDQRSPLSLSYEDQLRVNDVPVCSSKASLQRQRRLHSDPEIREIVLRGRECSMKNGKITQRK
ncbi:uncharacterized protein LOC136035293 [Artemia franciscana]|uniref:uncharacterized protein LOC136035293 n=1 Tax=Artemia franciscana TaxID=6661 RepID=UPI0032DB2BEC